MTLPELCIRRPVFATVLSLILVLVGLMAFSRLTIREYPNIDEPQVSVQTNYSGASAEIIESQVTQVLEGSLAGIEGIDTIESSSRSEISRITIRFRSGVAIDSATSDVRDRVSRVRRSLPDDISEPVISKVEADAQPIIFLIVRSAGMDALALTDYVDRFVADRFKNLDGVADVSINGERRYAMRIWIDHQSARRTRPDRAGCRERHPRPERRNPGRPHRGNRARIHRSVAHLAGHAGGVPPDQAEERGRPCR
jgi:multidrug efflux pump